MKPQNSKPAGPIFGVHAQAAGSGMQLTQGQYLNEATRTAAQAKVAMPQATITVTFDKDGTHTPLVEVK